MSPRSQKTTLITLETTDNTVVEAPAEPHALKAVFNDIFEANLA
jgi:hypothetical protein